MPRFDPRTLPARHLFLLALVLAALLGTALVLPSPVWEPRVGAPGSTHIHASLFFHVNGTSVELTRRFLGQAERVHFHAPDSILHVHATGLTLGYALDTLPVALNDTCVTVTGTRSCAGDGTVVTVLVNGEPVNPAAAKNRVIRQGDTITVFHGETPETLPDRYRHRRLPSQYREQDSGTPV